MKSSPEKSTHATTTAEQQKSAQPFFAKANGGDFFAPVHVQAKLKVNAPDDKYEQEADKMADRVMRMTIPGQSSNIQKAALPEEKVQMASLSGEKPIQDILNDRQKEENRTTRPALPKDKQITPPEERSIQDILNDRRKEENRTIGPALPKDKQITPPEERSIQDILNDRRKEENRTTGPALPKDKQITPPEERSIQDILNDRQKEENRTTRPALPKDKQITPPEERSIQDILNDRRKEENRTTGPALPKDKQITPPGSIQDILNDRQKEENRTTGPAILKDKQIALPEEKVQRASGPEEKVQMATLSEENVQKKGKDSTESEEKSGLEVGPKTKTKIMNEMSGGQPLPKDIKKFMEPRFDTDFSNVRIHNNKESSNLNNQLNAKAFTYKDHIFFSGEHYNPTSNEGKKLLAHELTHVVQQSPTGSLKRKKISEHEDKNNSLRLSAISSTGSVVIQRDMLNKIRGGFDALSGAVKGVVVSVGQAIGSGVDIAYQFISSVASTLGLGLAVAWSWLNRLGGFFKLGIKAAWSLIQQISSLIGLGISEALNWVQQLAVVVGLGANAAWNWIKLLSNVLGKGVKIALNWIKVVSGVLGLGVQVALNWIKLLAATLGTGISIGWNWIQTLAGVVGLGAKAAWNWIKMLSGFIGMGVSPSWDWIRQLGAIINTGVIGAWNWIRQLSAVVNFGITIAWGWIQQVSAIIGYGAKLAWNWLKMLAQTINSGILTAWNWIQQLAAIVGFGVTLALIWIRQVSVVMRLGLMMAWNFLKLLVQFVGLGAVIVWVWIQEVASILMMGITIAWNFLKLVVATIRLGFRIAWNWLLKAASKLAMIVTKAWNFLLNLAKKLLKTILEAWDWYWNAPSIAIETNFSAPDGSGKSRTNVGVGEKVTFKGSKLGDWTISGGTPTSLASATDLRWTAPNRATSINIALISGKYTRKMAMNVLEPNAITTRRVRVLSYARGRMGAGMELKFIYHPKNVSFGNVQTKEVSGPATNIRGYFKDRGGNYPHDASGGTGTDPFYSIQSDNEDSATDEASIRNYSSPWKSGGYDWIIPNKFRVATEGGDGKEYTRVTQAFTLVDRTGLTRVTKGGSEVERSPW